MTTISTTIAPRRAGYPVARFLRWLLKRLPRPAQKPPYHMTPQLERDMGLIDYEKPRPRIEIQRDPTFRHPMF